MSHRRARRPTLRILAALAILALLGLAPSCGDSGAAPVGPAGQGAGAPFTFSWPVPCHVGVTETQVKDGKTAVTRYLIDIARAEDGSNIAMRTSHFEMEAFTGLDLNDPEARKSIAPAIAMSDALPTLLVAPDGRAQKIVGTEQAVEQVMASLKDAGTNENVIASIGNMLQSPPVLATMRQKVFDAWMVWVGAWVGLQLQPGESVDSKLQVPMPDGTICDAPTTVRFLSLDGGHAQISATSVLEGDAPRLALGRVMSELANKPAPDQNEPFDPEAIQSFRRVTTFSVVTDPVTLRPLKATSETTQTVAMKGLGSRTSLESRTWVFDWTEVNAAASTR